VGLRQAAQVVVSSAVSFRNEMGSWTTEIKHQELELLRAALAEPEWILCSERLPEMQELYLIAYKHYGDWRYAIACYLIDGTRWEGDDGFTYWPSHWRPMPDPPRDALK